MCVHTYIHTHTHTYTYTRVYPKVSGLAIWSENCKRYSSLPQGAALSLFCKSSEFCRHNPLYCFSTSVCCCCLLRIDSARKLLGTRSYIHILIFRFLDIRRKGKIFMNWVAAKIPRIRCVLNIVHAILMSLKMRVLRFSRRWRFKSWSSGLWRCVVMWYNSLWNISYLPHFLGIFHLSLGCYFILHYSRVETL
jgi:hypothetical protein